MSLFIVTLARSLFRRKTKCWTSSLMLSVAYSYCSSANDHCEIICNALCRGAAAAHLVPFLHSMRRISFQQRRWTQVWNRRKRRICTFLSVHFFPSFLRHCWLDHLSIATSSFARWYIYKSSPDLASAAFLLLLLLLYSCLWWWFWRSSKTAHNGEKMRKNTLCLCDIKRHILSGDGNAQWAHR